MLGAQTAKLTRYLYRGMKGDDVLYLQKLLVAKKFLAASAAIGIFGPKTEAAVIAYQKSIGVEALGTVGPLTRAALNARR